LLPLPSTNKQSSLTININKQTIISHHYHQQTNNHLPLLTTLTNNPLTITIVYLLMVMVKDDCLFVDCNGERWLFVCWWKWWEMIVFCWWNNHLSPLHQQTNNELSPIPSTNKQSSLTITIKKQTVISHHYHQQINNHLSPLTSTNS
jgi:hypothetical protein